MNWTWTVDMLVGTGIQLMETGLGWKEPHGDGLGWKEPHGNGVDIETDFMETGWQMERKLGWVG